MRIIGIDPGYAICGYGIIDVIGSSLKPVTYGVITTEAKTPEASRLEIIFNELSDILEEFRPQKFGIEKLYFARNVTTGIGESTRLTNLRIYTIAGETICGGLWESYKRTGHVYDDELIGDS